MPGVLVVDDQHLIRAGLLALLRTDPALSPVTEAADGPGAIEAARTGRPDLVLMDIKMPEMSGLTAAEHILALPLDPAPRVVVLTTFDEDEFVYAALRIGCSGFLLKDTPPAQLLAAVTATLSGDVLVAPHRVRRLVEQRVATVSRRTGDPAMLGALTERETEVLRLVGQGRSNEEISGTVCISEATVKTHLHRVMSKLDLRSRAQAVVFAYESGLVVAGGGHPSP
ncbi:response regulator [Streptomyces sp. NPDC004111]|uniref:response regulator n=1 Tax=Streptomyces sp. NPDC004111 TaxID=3364690 RepID=UPI0036966C66